MKLYRPLAAVLVLLLGLMNASVGSAQNSSWTCQDFRNAGINPNDGYYRKALDRDGDGIACDWPSSSGGGTSSNLPGAAPVAPANQTAQSVALCSGFDAWPWAQYEYELARNLLVGMDPDGDGIVCDTMPLNGFGPVDFAPGVPPTAQQATFVSVVDAENIVVQLNGVPTTVHLHETKSALPTQCGYAEGRDYLTWVLGLIPNQTLYIESAGKTGTSLEGYVWFPLGNDTYMANEVMLRQGWSQLNTQTGTRSYAEVLKISEDFATRHMMGAHLACGGFNKPLGSQPTPAQVQAALKVQPNQGQFAKWIGTTQPASNQPANTQPVNNQPAVNQPVNNAPATVTPTVSTTPTPGAGLTPTVAPTSAVEPTPTFCPGMDCLPGDSSQTPVPTVPTDTVPTDPNPTVPADTVPTDPNPTVPADTAPTDPIPTTPAGLRPDGVVA